MSSSKRLLSALPNATPDADTSVELQHRNKMPKKDDHLRKLLDPVYILNEDTLNIIFECLPIVDILSCGFLNKAWEFTVLRWMNQTRKLVGLKLRRICSKAVPATVWHGLSIAEIKYYASNLSRTQFAKATSLFACHGPIGYVDVGDFAVYLSTGDPKYSNLHSVLRWRPLHPSNNPEHNETRVYEIPKVSDRFRNGFLIGLLVNRDGVILANLEYPYVNKRRLLVYSPVEEKRLWDHLFPIKSMGANSTSWPVAFGPVALGQSHVYCMGIEAYGKYYLISYDFRTGKEVYQVCRGVHQSASVDPWLPDNRPTPARLIRLVEVNGEELLIFLTGGEVFGLKTTVEIVRGRDGQQLHIIPYSLAWKASCLADPLTKQVALIWYKPAMGTAHIYESTTLVQTFSYHPNQPITLSPLIAVQRNMACSQYETLQPFTMTNIEVIPTLIGQSPTKFTIACSNLVRVHNHMVRHLAHLAAKDLFFHATTPIRCYTVDNPRTVTVSEPACSSLATDSKKTETLSVDALTTPAVYWLDHARLVVQTMNYTRVVRF